MINDILNKYINNEKFIKFTNYSLDSISKILIHLKNPHNNFKSLHVAGTNGKGSTSFMLADILFKSGYKTGLYTSPHLIRINERIKINNKDIDDTLLLKYLCRIDSIIKDDPTIVPSYFDILTAAAFSFFSDEAVDIAIIETGLGGRLDSTNVITPEISIITDISLDHTNILGKSISEITREKCGIIKPVIPVISSNTNIEIITIIQEYSKNNNAKFLAYDSNFFTENIRWEKNLFVFDYLTDKEKLPEVKLSLFPIHQVKNAAVVIAALKELTITGYKNITDEIIYNQLEKINVPGRFQIINENPLIIFDPAHNYNALNNLITGLEKTYSNTKKIFILSMMKDKADDKTLGLFKNQEVIYYLLNDERSYIPDANEFKIIISDFNIIIDIVKKAEKNDLMIIFTGTFRHYNDAIRLSELLYD